MERHRTARPTAHAPAVVALAALQLVLTTSAVGVTQQTANHVTDPAPRPAPAETARTAVIADLRSTEPTEGTPTAYAPLARPTLGGERPGEIPWPALQAYQRAAEILGEVHPRCGMSWQLLAAVGHVESDHGRALGRELGDDGVVRPALVGKSVDGAGARPVGPMQLLSDTWRVVGVDGDGDGERSAQDLDDAALATGVYLCASGTGVGTREAATAALLSLNAATSYVDEVLAAAAKYRNGDFGVAGGPNPQSIGRTLDYGPGTPAQRKEAEPAVHEAKEQTLSSTARPARAELGDGEEQRRSAAAGTEQTGTRPVAKPQESAAEGATREPAEEQDEPRQAATTPEPNPTTPEPEPTTSEPDPTTSEPEPTTSDEQAMPVGSSQPAADEADTANDDKAGVGSEPGGDNGSDRAEIEPRLDPVPEAEPEPEAEPDDDIADEDSEPAEAEPAEAEPAEEAPATATLIGTLTACGEAGADYCLDDLALDLAGVEDPELAGLEGKTVELVVLEGAPLFVVAVNGIVQVP